MYGDAPPEPRPEDAPRSRRVSPYAASKAAAELACRAGRRSLDVVVARPFAHDGPGQDERFAVGSWARADRAARARTAAARCASATSTAERDLIDVRDVCRAYRLLLDPAVPAGTYNVASGEAVALADVARPARRRSRACRCEVERDPARLRPADIRRLAGDAGRLRAATGWEPDDPARADPRGRARGGARRSAEAESGA